MEMIHLEQQSYKQYLKDSKAYKEYLEALKRATGKSNESYKNRKPGKDKSKVS